MTVDEIMEYGQAKPGAEASFPFDDQTLVLKVGGKIFLLMSLEQYPPSIAVKSDPDQSLELRAQHPQITGAYHMNKKHWNSVVCQGISSRLVYDLIDQSYETIFNSLTKKLRQQISTETAR